jgi:hypothetical protein
MLHHTFHCSPEELRTHSIRASRLSKLEESVEKDQLQQFLAATHCCAELAKMPSTAEAIVAAGVISMVLSMLHQILPEGTDVKPVDMKDVPHNSKVEYSVEVEAMCHLWSILASLSNNTEFLKKLMSEPNLLWVVKKEIEVGLHKCRICVAHLVFHITRHLQEEGISSLPHQHETLLDLVVSVKGLLSHPAGRDADLQMSTNENARQVVSLALLSLVHLAENVVSCRSHLLSTDMMEILQTALLINENQSRADVFSILLLLYILSKEESLCIKLLDYGIHPFLVSLGDFVENESSSTTPVIFIRDSQIKKKSKKQYLAMQVPPLSEGLLYSRRGKDLIASTLLNLSLKRGVVSPGVLPLLLSLVKNCRSSRAMWVARCLAYISVHPRAKIALLKETRLMSVVTGVMRNGCEEAEKAQLYCSIVICNFLAQPLTRVIVDKMIKDEEVKSLVVVSLLRVSAHVVVSDSSSDINPNMAMSLNQRTKESLGKALFNLLARADSRTQMANPENKVFDALVDLSKLENIDILELSMRAGMNELYHHVIVV